MYLSELYGRIGQILNEYGDMTVARPRTSTDGICTDKPYWEKMESQDFHLDIPSKVFLIDW